MRSNFALMKDLSMHTKVTPDQRQSSLMAFLRRMDNDEAVRKLLSGMLRTDPSFRISIPDKVLTYVENMYSHSEIIIIIMDKNVSTLLHTT
jgi:hypothetical protein